jgi:hypothetical protein
MGLDIPAVNCDRPLFSEPDNFSDGSGFVVNATYPATVLVNPGNKTHERSGARRILIVAVDPLD